MDVDTFRALLTDEGQAVLAAVRDPDPATWPATLTALRWDHPAELVAAAVEQGRLRREAEAKFGADAQRMYFTRDGLDHASHRAVAEYKLGRVLDEMGVVFLDVCHLGTGADALFSGVVARRHRRRQRSVERRRHRGQCRGPGRAVHAMCPGAGPHGLRALGRGGLRRRRAAGRAGGSYGPAGLGAVAGLGAGHRPRHRGGGGPGWVPTSRSGSVPGGLRDRRDRVDLLGRGKCRRPSCSGSGRAGPAARVPSRATLFPGRGPHYPPGGGAPPPVRPPGRYLYEVDAAVVGAGLVAEVAEDVGGGVLDAAAPACVTSDEARATPFATAYEITEVLPYDPAASGALSRGRGAGGLTVRQHGCAAEAAELGRYAGPGGDGAATVFLTRVAGEPTLLLVRPAG
ncbi:predicted protein [Streptomyces sp. C]|nr:predicted protein [Streptomyces sp. C]